jgi:hypothetical protein
MGSVSVVVAPTVTAVTAVKQTSTPPPACPKLGAAVPA